MMGPPINKDRDLAHLTGDRVYTGRPCKRCTMTLRYVKNSCCVYCQRCHSEGQRDTAKLKRARARPYAVCVSCPDPSNCRAERYCQELKITVTIGDISAETVRAVFSPQIDEDFVNDEEREAMAPTADDLDKPPDDGLTPEERYQQGLEDIL